MTTKARASRAAEDAWGGTYVPLVPLPPAESWMDELVNVMVSGWNRQRHDETAAVFFGSCLFGERHELVAESIYRWPDEQDRQFATRWLMELSRAIDGGTFRWTSAH